MQLNPGRPNESSWHRRSVKSKSNRGNKMTEEKIFTYIRAMWYESKCKSYDEIRRIIKEETENNPDLSYDKLCLKTLRRCQSEL